ncbi:MULTISPECIES: hypothetical protein [unclassified Halorhabdus]|uniref:DUF7835 family putative zinc beta-ribbon protein n=1 Tax=unclassified Halorhabdus TaxID=2621901 RepID=UPI0023DCD1A5|nr:MULTISPECIES: hypothetical protein [unclassified Halorhabdus]WEL17588.1 Zn finger protein, C2H2 type [Halorhabdus sp. SVX81]WEL21469.1 Zn finger protein, C2H2 type [Halorhabdus sp. BNX81]
MATANQATNTRVEYCSSCRGEHPHDVSITLLTENEASDNAAYSREPYRVSVCRSCGQRTERRMNDA